MSSDSEDASCTDDEEYVPAESEVSDDEVGCVENNDEDGEEPEQNESAKKEIDKIWNDFKAEVATGENSKSKLSDSENGKPETKEKSTSSKNSETKKINEEKKTITVTKVFDFAGEEVKVTKEVDKESKEGKDLIRLGSRTTSLISKPGISRTMKRPGGGLQGVLGKIGKKQKISTLEKSKLDWTDYKQKEGIEDELQSHNKGKGGYLEKQSFLERTDLRLFAKERERRLGTKGKR